MFCVSRTRVCAMLTCLAVLAVAQMAEAQTFRRAAVFRVVRPQQRSVPRQSTRAAIENVTVYRAQLRVKTANVKDANTDDAVMVRLGNMPGTWLDLSIDDRERGRTNTL